MLRHKRPGRFISFAFATEEASTRMFAMRCTSNKHPTRAQQLGCMHKQKGVVDGQRCGYLTGGRLPASCMPEQARPASSSRPPSKGVASALPPVPCQLATQVLILVALSLNECFFCFLKKFPSRPHAVVPFPWLHQAPLPWSCCQAPQAADALRLTQRTRVHHRGYQCCCCRLCTAGCVSVHVKLGPAL